MSEHPNVDLSKGEYSPNYPMEKLSDIYDWEEWKTAIERQIYDLSERVSELEPKNTRRSLRERISSFASAKEDGYCGLRTCIHLVRTRKAALGQCIWLISFIVLLSILGVKDFSRARNNLEAKFKPEKKLKTVNYYETRQDETYEMPYIYIYFSWRAVNERNETQYSSEMLNQTLENLLKSQKYFQWAMITYITREGKVWTDWLPLDETEALCVEGSIEPQGCFGYFRIKPSNPITNGYYDIHLPVNIRALTLSSTIWLYGFWLSVEKQMTPQYWGDWVYVSMEDALTTDLSYLSIIDFQERVIRKYGNEYAHVFSTSLEWYGPMNRDFLNESGWIDFQFRGNLMVEHWAEYVEYGYFDWLSNMGGIISISSILFLWGAYYIAVLFGETSHMGILPQISFIFSNYEKISLVTERKIKL